MARLWGSRILREQEPRIIEAEMNHCTGNGVRPYNFGPDPSRSLIPAETRRIAFHDLRGASPAPNLDTAGFALHRHRSAVRDFTDPAEVVSVYFGEMAQLLRDYSGASRVFLLSQYVLRSRLHAKSYDAGVIAESAATVAHVDYTSASVRPAARAVMRREGDRSEPDGRIVFYTLWRCITPPPQDMPLAICDLRTVEPEDLLPADAYHQPGSPLDKAEFYLLKHHPRHRWGYYSDMRSDELLVFKQHDTGLPGVSGCPHAAFFDPGVHDAAPRLSIEVRGFALLDDGAPPIDRPLTPHGESKPAA